MKSKTLLLQEDLTKIVRAKNGAEPWQHLFTFCDLDACLPENPKSQLIQAETEMLGPGVSKSEGTK